LLSILIPYSEEIIGDNQCRFDATGQQLIIYSAFVKQLRRKGNTMKQCLSYLCFKKVYYSVRREVLYDIPIDFVIPMKVLRLIKVYLKEAYGRIRVGKYLSDKFPVKNCLKRR